MTTFTPEQVDEYLAYIKFPREQHPTDALERLTKLMAHHVCRVPFDTIGLHYSPHRAVSVDLDVLRHKILDQGRGGFCIEHNTLFGGVLTALGFQAYAVAARGKFGGPWMPAIHMLNIVVIDDKRYYVDVGMGTLGPLEPILLDKTADPKHLEHVQLAPRRVRLEWRPIDDPHYHSKLPVWIYATRENDQPGTPWVEFLAFADAECMPADLHMMNYWVTTHPMSYFVQTVLATRGIMGDDERLAGLMILHRDRVRRVMNGSEPETVETFASEAERIRGLDKYFDIKLSPIEQRSIQGFAAEIKEKRFIPGEERQLVK